MSATVEMFRKSGEPGRGDRFSCSLSVWEFLWELGRAYGWHPHGTTYVTPVGSKVETPARRNYQPGSPRDHKQVAEDDARGWARALEAAKASPHLPAMIEARSSLLVAKGRAGEEFLPGVLDEFIEFTHGGAFEFLTSADGGGAGEDVKH